MANTEQTRILSEYLNSFSGTHLPPLRQLATTLSVSTRSLRQTIALLVARGELIARSGGTYAISGRLQPRIDPALPVGAISSAERIADYFKTRILSGEIKSSNELPKRAVAARLLRVSQRTVGDAYRILESQRMVQRRGRGWYAGHVSDIRITEGSTGTLTILLLLPAEQRWRTLLDDVRSNQFITSFFRSAADQNVRVLPAVLSTRTVSKAVRIEGIRAISAEIRALGNLYKGTLLAARAGDLDGLQEILNTLIGLGRPVVWFPQREDSSPPPVISPYILRCGYSEQKFSEAAIEYCLTLGHRDVGYFSKGQTAWEKKRFAILQESGSRLGRSRIVAWWDAYEAARSSGVDGLSASLRRCARDGTPLQRKLVAYMANAYDLPPGSNIPVWPDSSVGALYSQLFLEGDTPPQFTFVRRLIPLLLRHDMTALIVANEQPARETLCWMKRMKVSIPADCSFVTYDNVLDGVSLPMDVVDPGGEGLGRRAVEVLLGRVPIREYLTEGGYGVMTAIPMVIRRATMLNPG